MKAPSTPTRAARANQKTVICEVGRIVTGRTVIYRLCLEGSVYYAELMLEEDRCRLELGSCFGEAATLYEILVKGLVTPCSAPFILEDFLG